MKERKERREGKEEKERKKEEVKIRRKEGKKIMKERKRERIKKKSFTGKELYSPGKIGLSLFGNRPLLRPIQTYIISTTCIYVIHTDDLTLVLC